MDSFPTKAVGQPSTSSAILVDQLPSVPYKMGTSTQVCGHQPKSVWVYISTIRIPYFSGGMSLSPFGRENPPVVGRTKPYGLDETTLMASCRASIERMTLLAKPKPFWEERLFQKTALKMNIAMENHH